MDNLHELYRNWLFQKDFFGDKTPLFYNITVIIAFLIIAYIAYKLCVYIFNKSVNIIQRKDKLIFPALQKNKVIKIASWFIPLVICKYGIDGLFQESSLPGILEGIYKLLIIVFFARLCTSCLNAFVDIYKSNEKNKSKPIRGFIQFIQIIIGFFTVMLIISVLFNVKLSAMLTGLGAASAILMLIFKDSITGLIAGLQISFNQMVKIGDWIEVPKYGVDGDVIDITLTSVKVQNWDKTISTVPTYSLLVNDSVKNWQGMVDFGGRRIARSIYIDMKSVKICDAEMLDRFRKIKLVSGYVEKIQDDVKAYNESLNITEDDLLINGRRQTNLGVFRAYLDNYIRHKEGIDPNKMILVRQMAPGETGIPIQIYCFTKTTVWVQYESIQSDIFDHVLAVINYFDLRVFQAPTGEDFWKTFNGQDNAAIK